MSKSSNIKPVTRPIRRILVCTKYRFIGDTLLAIPLLRAIHKRWPDASISLLTGALAQEVLKHCPYVQDVIEFDPYRPCDKGLSKYIGLIARLRRRHFDLAFVCNRSFHSALTAFLGGARMRVGWLGFEGRDCLLTHSTEYIGDRPEIDSYLDLYQCVDLGAVVDDRMELWLTEGERAAAVLRAPSGSPLIGLQPGATHAEKRWPSERYAALCRALLESEPDTRFLILGGPEERSSAEAMLAACSANVRDCTTSMVGALELRETVAMLTCLDLFVAGDTAIRHAAMALGTPTVGLFGPTSMQKWGNAMPPKHATLLSTEKQVATISVEVVLQAAQGALACRANAPAREVQV